MRIFTKKQLLNLGLPENAIVDKIISNSRWSIQHEIIFKYEDKFFKTYYQVGATENQIEYPWDHNIEIECYEVELIKKEIYVWEQKK